MVAVVFGIPGVGKSTIVNRVKDDLSLVYIHPGNIMYEIASEKGIVENVDQMRKLKLSVQQQLQEEMAGVVAEKINSQKENSFIIDTHAIVKTPQGFFPGLRNAFFEVVQPDIYLVVESKPEMILQRRTADKDRVRQDDHSLDEILLHIDLTRDFASAYSIYSQANFAVIENKEGDIDYAVNEMSGIISRFMEIQ
ncbi:MAG TPA: adenylate kinase [Candidatus Dojkabacteria bacterium]|nr:adenylate kinase [Candidatus Dojkabacteria bacterium]HRP36428.1 adenylate kinase [Candidatus Dojkabacteria bacterium]HRP51072.1 adenylate kinase [Candidatus Dojkabacteria bacterium]